MSFRRRSGWLVLAVPGALAGGFFLGVQAHQPEPVEAQPGSCHETGCPSGKRCLSCGGGYPRCEPSGSFCCGTRGDMCRPNQSCVPNGDGTGSHCQ